MPNVTLTDADTNFPLQKVEISSQPACDPTSARCTLSSSSPLPHNFTYANGVWTLWNVGYAYKFQQILRRIWIFFDTLEQIEASFLFTVTVYDSADTAVNNCDTTFGGFIVTDEFQLYFIPVNDIAPVLDLNGPSNPGIDFSTTFIEESVPISLVDSQLTLTDDDKPSLSQYDFKIYIYVSVLGFCLVFLFLSLLYLDCALLS